MLISLFFFNLLEANPLYEGSSKFNRTVFSLQDPKFSKPIMERYEKKRAKLKKLMDALDKKLAQYDSLQLHDQTTKTIEKLKRQINSIFQECVDELRHLARIAGGLMHREKKAYLKYHEDINSIESILKEKNELISRITAK